MSYAPLLSESTLRIIATYTPTTSVSETRTKRNQKSVRKPKKSPSARPLSTNYPIIVHCHLCWDWVWQRPQQFLSRLSHDHKVLFVETLAPDPHLASPVARFSRPEPFPNLTILRLQFPAWRWDDAEFVDQERRRLVQDFVDSTIANGDFDAPIQWFYDPMAVSAFAGQMNEVLTVYDCMDELSKFRFAPPELTRREAELLARADVVFTGGRKLFESKSRHNQNCHFYGCGVDAAHFGKALSEETPIPPEMTALPGPMFGYFGVVDERLDYELIAHLADGNKSGSVVIIGPVLKVDPAALPKRPNLHWLGQRSYADLPSYCKAFDVCLMPFALNEATEFINPTKALEYMATGRPIVSTAIADVVSNFNSVVGIANDREKFTGLCLAAAREPDRAAIQRGHEMVRANSWEAIVKKMEGHLQDALNARDKSDTASNKAGVGA
jgi:glycosyltransferase involved in cell wall biosynthesis